MENKTRSGPKIRVLVTGTVLVLIWVFGLERVGLRQSSIDTFDTPSVGASELGGSTVGLKTGYTQDRERVPLHELYIGIVLASADEMPLSGARVSLLGESAEVIATVMSNEEGGFELQCALGEGVSIEIHLEAYQSCNLDLSAASTSEGVMELNSDGEIGGAAGIVVRLERSVFRVVQFAWEDGTPCAGGVASLTEGMEWTAGIGRELLDDNGQIEIRSDSGTGLLNAVFFLRGVHPWYATKIDVSQDFENGSFRVIVPKPCELSVELNLPEEYIASALVLRSAIIGLNVNTGLFSAPQAGDLKNGDRLISDLRRGDRLRLTLHSSEFSTVMIESELVITKEKQVFTKTVFAESISARKRPERRVFLQRYKLVSPDNETLTMKDLLSVGAGVGSIEATCVTSSGETRKRIPDSPEPGALLGGAFALEGDPPANVSLSFRGEPLRQKSTSRSNGEIAFILDLDSIKSHRSPVRIVCAVGSSTTMLSRVLFEERNTGEKYIAAASGPSFESALIWLPQGDYQILAVGAGREEGEGVVDVAGAGSKEIRVPVAMLGVGLLRGELVGLGNVHSYAISLKPISGVSPSGISTDNSVKARAGREFKFDGVVAGKYHLVIEWNDSLQSSAAVIDSVEIQSGVRSDVDIDLPNAMGLMGVVELSPGPLKAPWALVRSEDGVEVFRAPIFGEKMLWLPLGRYAVSWFPSSVNFMDVDLDVPIGFQEFAILKDSPMESSP